MQASVSTIWDIIIRRCVKVARFDRCALEPIQSNQFVLQLMNVMATDTCCVQWLKLKPDDVTYRVMERNGTVLLLQ